MPLQRWHQHEHIQLYMNMKTNGGLPATMATSAVSGANAVKPFNKAKWEVMLARRLAYEVAHGHYNVPRHWVEDPKLGDSVRY